MSLEEYARGMVLLLSRTSTFGITGMTLVLSLVLLVLLLIGVILCARIARQLYCLGHVEVTVPMLVRGVDREWFRLATVLLRRAECITGRQVRTIVRGLPGVVLDNDGQFTSLGAIPFEGLLSVGSALWRTSGIVVLLPLFRNSETRRILRLMIAT